MSDKDTIFALATGHGTAGIAVVRLSGPQSWKTIKHLTRRPIPEPRHLSRRWIYSRDDERIDDVMVVVFEAGASFTGQQAAEIHCHGSRAVINALLDILDSQDGCREAQPGEFTRRAFDAGQMDLNEVEGLGDLIHAETEFQRRQALRVMSGAASNQISAWRADLIRARALIEVTIDWADEEVPEDVSPEFVELLSGVSDQMAAEKQKFTRTERLREGFEVAIVGAPNAGKSTLVNAIAGREVAITSEIAGTTRDIIETRCDLKGLPVTFLDTAGIRNSEDAIERAGVDIARKRARSADLRVFLRASDCQPVDQDLFEDDDISVWSKADLGAGPGDIQISAMTNAGIAELISMVYERLATKIDQLSVFGHRRQHNAISRCHDVICLALSEAATVDAEVLAEHLRIALVELDSLTGRNGVEDVLGEVFSSFCLGK